MYFNVTLTALKIHFVRSFHKNVLHIPNFHRDINILHNGAALQKSFAKLVHSVLSESMFPHFYIVLFLLSTLTFCCHPFSALLC